MHFCMLKLLSFDLRKIMYLVLDRLLIVQKGERSSIYDALSLYVSFITSLTHPGVCL